MEGVDLEQVKETAKAERIWRTTEASKVGQLAAIEKQVAGVRKQLALLAAAMGAALPK